MAKICYRDCNLRGKSLTVVNQANAIIVEYQQQGFQLTLRQLYYQFVSRDLLANTTQNYKRLGTIVNDGRLAGLIDWDAIEDRTRSLASLLTFENPADRIQHAARAYRIDMWEHQPHRIEIWVEKEALAGVIEVTANRNRVPYLSCRGYTSQSEMWNAGMRLKAWVDTHEQDVVILHLGDHDPSGIDMSRDIEDRLAMFMGDSFAKLTFHRIALNMDQVRQYRPPPNPAKTTDSRFEGYIKKFGRESWELDALDPKVLDALVESFITRYRNGKQWNKDAARETTERTLLTKASDQWSAVVEYLEQFDD